MPWPAPPPPPPPALRLSVKVPGLVVALPSPAAPSMALLLQLELAEAHASCSSDAEAGEVRSARAEVSGLRLLVGSSGSGGMLTRTWELRPGCSPHYLLERCCMPPPAN